MMNLLVLILVFLTSSTQSQVIIEQNQISITKTGDGQSLALITCSVKPAYYVHWYVQKQEGLKRILYMEPGKTVYDDEVNKKRIFISDDYTLTIQQLTYEDEGTYYCAKWDSYTRDRKFFGPGTQLIISKQTVKEPEVVILKSNIEDENREEFAIYMCNLQNFFPGVIKVAWNEGDSENELQSEQGEIIHNTDNNTYSLSSWIKVMKSDLGKRFTCKYKHEKSGDRWIVESIRGNKYVQDIPIKEPEVTILKSSKEEVDREGFAIYVCNLQNFFPVVIRVVWIKGDCEQEVKSEHGEIKHNTDSNTYSFRSSIKVSKYDLQKTFTCKYNQGTTKEGWKNTSVSGIEYTQVSPGTPLLNRMMYRAAQITYAMLLLKTVMYCPLLIFLNSKEKP